MIFKACIGVAAVQTAYKLLIGWRPDPLKVFDKLLKELYLEPMLEWLNQPVSLFRGMLHE